MAFSMGSAKTGKINSGVSGTKCVKQFRPLRVKITGEYSTQKIGTFELNFKILKITDVTGVTGFHDPFR